MPHAFARELFELTKVGLRVVVVRGDMSPIEIAHPALFKPGPVRSDVALAMVTDRASDALPSKPLQRAVHPPPADKGTDVRWSALSMYANAGNTEPYPSADPRRRANRDTAPAAASSEAAMAALERITLPQEAIERINELISPGSSLIVSDEVASRETGNGADFVVLMSGEPQGVVMIRRRPPAASYRNDRSRRAPRPSGNPFFWW